MPARHMDSLEEQYRDDPVLLAFYQKRLLEPGWAGEVNDAEAAYIARELSRRPEARRLWQTAKFTWYKRRITLAVAKRLARIWAEMPASAIAMASDRYGSAEAPASGEGQATKSRKPKEG